MTDDAGSRDPFESPSPGAWQPPPPPPPQPGPGLSATTPQASPADPPDPAPQSASDPFAPRGPSAPQDPFAPAHPFATSEGVAFGGSSVADAPPWFAGLPGAPVAAPSRARRGWLVPLAVVLALLAGVVGGAVGYGIAYRQDSSLTDANVSLGSADAGSSSRPNDSVAGIAARVLPTVVSISVRSGTEGGTGSGFVIDGKGYVLTNNHVIAVAADGNGTIDVTYSDGKSESARIVGRDVSYDLAVLKVGRRDLSVLRLGDSDGAVVGDSVVAIGSPLGLQGTVTTGIVSAKNRPVTTTGESSSDESFINAIQTDSAINPGNSGGPLVDASGAAIGVNSAIASLGQGSGQSGSIGVGFAIPINQARRVAEEIINTGTSTHPVIGASVDSSYDGPGARIASEKAPDGTAPLVPGGPADKAGIKPGDVVLQVDGRGVNGAGELIVAIRSRAPGETVTLKVRSGGKDRTVSVRLGSQSGT